MTPRRLACSLLLVCGISGCLTENTDRFGRFGKTPIPPNDKLPKGSLEAASRVDALGRQIIASNPDLSVNPLFMTIGVPQVTAFHRGVTDIYVSDGVVQRCKTDGELAAVLCNELAKMMLEAEAQGRTKPAPERDRPYTPNLHRDGDPDQTQLAEQAIFEKSNPRRRPVNAPPEKDPAELARGYLTKAGFAADDLANAATLIRQAESNPNFNQILGPRTDSLGIPRPR